MELSERRISVINFSHIDFKRQIFKDMEKVCLLCRVSTQAQDYEYQISTLSELCKSKGWEVVKVFANKVSGAKKNEERSEIKELVEFVKTNKVDRVCATEISRIGRNTLEALKTIQILSDHNVNLYLANYNIETLDRNGKPNPIASLILTICLEISSYERGLIRSRMEMGYKEYVRQSKEQGKPMGRPISYQKSEEAYKKQYKQDINLLKKRLSLRNVHSITGTSINTLRKLKNILDF